MNRTSFFRGGQLRAMKNIMFQPRVKATGSDWQPKLDFEKKKKEERKLSNLLRAFRERMLACPRNPNNYCSARLLKGRNV